MSSSVKKRKHKISFFKSLIDKKILLAVIIFLAVSSFFLVIGGINTVYDIRSRAQGVDPYCPANCNNGENDPCTGKNINGLYDAGCCAEVQKTGEPYSCTNPYNRMWCFPEECASIPEGVSPMRCASARTEYCNRCKQHGCYGSVNPTAPPAPTAVPTNPPVPTTNNPSPPLGVNPQPTTYIPPTQVPIDDGSNPQPTSYILPTQAPIDDYNPQPRPTDDRPLADTTSNPQPKTILPDFKPIINSITKSVNLFIQKTQNSLKQFFATILP